MISLMMNSGIVYISLKISQSGWALWSVGIFIAGKSEKVPNVRKLK
jgi:hypothetical protein